MPAVTFDLWHTLVFLPPEAEEAYMRAQLEVAVRALASAPRLPGAAAMSETELAQAFRQVLGDAVAEADRGRTVTVTDQLDRAGRATGREPDAERYLQELERTVSRTPFQTTPGALDLLSGLKEERFRLGIISNTVGEPGRFLRPMLASMRLLRLFESIVFSDEHPWTKPAPEIFELSLRELGETARQTVHVGDGWSDIEGARRARFRAGILFTGLQQYGPTYQTLFAPRNRQGGRADHEVGGLEEVGPMVHRILDSH